MAMARPEQRMAGLIYMDGGRQRGGGAGPGTQGPGGRERGEVGRPKGDQIWNVENLML